MAQFFWTPTSKNTGKLKMDMRPKIFWRSDVFDPLTRPAPDWRSTFSFHPLWIWVNTHSDLSSHNFSSILWDSVPSEIPDPSLISQCRASAQMISNSLCALAIIKTPLLGGGIHQEAKNVQIQQPIKRNYWLRLCVNSFSCTLDLVVFFLNFLRRNILFIVPIVQFNRIK